MKIYSGLRTVNLVRVYAVPYGPVIYLLHIFWRCCCMQNVLGEGEAEKEMSNSLFDLNGK
jgi:hypothetical protein